MSIPMTKYVNITSGVGGGSNVATRQLIGCVFTENTLVDYLAAVTFNNATEVGEYFGTTSEEYLRSVMYFGYVSPAIRTPQSIMFARYNSAASPAIIYGAKGTYVYTELQAVTAGTMCFNFSEAPATITAGSFVVGTEYEITTVGTTDFTLIGAADSVVGTIFTATGVGAGTGTATSTGNVFMTAITLAAASSLADAAAKLQTAFRLNANAHFTTCTVTYDAVNTRFIFTASDSGVVTAEFTVPQAGSGVTDLALQLGWYESDGALVNSSIVAKTPVQAFTNAVLINNNFGSFCFTTASGTTLAQQIAIASYNATLNVMFQYNIHVTASDYVATAAALAAIAGVGLTYELSTLNQYPEMIPMAILAATDPTQRNGCANNYMYRQVTGISPSVTDPTVQAALDAVLVNYYGQTQTAGQLISFYQNGVLCGVPTSPQFMNIFANEQWFKDYVAAALLSLQLSLPEVSANTLGRGQLMSILQSAISQAVYNGTISVGKTLTTLQQLYVTEMTGDDLAWLMVQNIGYWFDVQLVQSVDPVSHLTIYTAVYTVIYSKNDAVRSISGSHVLI